MLSQAGSIARMSDERMIRAENLSKLLKDEGWSYTHFGGLMKVSGAYIGKLANCKTPFTEKTARRIEEVACKPPYWLDQIHEWSSDDARAQHASGRSFRTDTQANAIAAEAQGIYHAPHKQGDVTFTSPSSSANMLITAPVVAWADLEVGLMKSNREWPDTGHEKFIAITDGVSDRVKCLVVVESKIPTISPGDHIAVDSHAPLVEDCVVVIKLVGGRMELRRYRALADGTWEAIAPNEPPLDQKRHGLTLIGRVVALNKRQF